MACKYTAADSVKGLNQIFQHLLDSTPQHAPGGRATCFMVCGQLLKYIRPASCRGKVGGRRVGSLLQCACLAAAQHCCPASFLPPCRRGDGALELLALLPMAAHYDLKSCPLPQR